MMKQWFLEFMEYYEVFVGSYGIIYLTLYLFLAVVSFYAIKVYSNAKYSIKDSAILKSNHVLGVSIVAPAFNEGVNIVYNVRSLLALNYPKFEVVIINDGSTDDTLEKLIREFELVKVDFMYDAKIATKRIRGHYKSSNPVYSKLLVVDKENGKSKADASNAGINSAKYPLFLCTDVDCILRRDTIIKLARPFMESTVRVIASGAAIRASNSCVVEDGFMEEVHFPKKRPAAFQELEYIRAFLFGRMAWSQLNGLLLVSGGLGLFDKEIAVKAGGYWHKSLGEDMELITRMRKFMHERKEKFKIIYIPESLCWTEVPPNLKILIRQRTRWARGLVQTLYLHRTMFFRPKYGVTAFITLPYFFLFEFLVPILEVIGIIVLIMSAIWLDFNWEFLLIVSLFVYLFYFIITLISVLWDELLYGHYKNSKDVFSLVLHAAVEPIMYHPFTVYAAIKGYIQFIRATEQKWGVMQRQGFAKKEGEK